MASQFQLSPDLQRDLRARRYRHFPLEVNDECALVLKVPDDEAQSFARQDFRAGADLKYALMETAPVLRLACDILPAPIVRTLFQICFDLAESRNRRLVEHLGRQPAVKLFLLNTAAQPVGEWSITWGEDERQEARELLARALADLQAIPQGYYDFARARADLNARERHGELGGISSET